MKKISTNETYLNAIQEVAADPPPALTPPPSSLEAWMAKIGLLYGVPFEHFVANEALLPNESLRFFYVDENWIKSLIDGATSIGLQHSLDVALSLPTTAYLKKQVKKGRQLVRPALIGQKPPELTQSDKPMSGVLIRSVLISGWPGLEIYAYQDTQRQQEITKLRMDRLAPDVMLCLFAEKPQQIVLAEPKEGLRFGIYPRDGESGLWALARYLGEGTNPAIGTPVKKNGAQVHYPVPMRDVERGVLDLQAMPSGGNQLPDFLTDNGVQLPATGFRSAAFGVEMLLSEQRGVVTLKPAE